MSDTHNTNAPANDDTSQPNTPAAAAANDETRAEPPPDDLVRDRARDANRRVDEADRAEADARAARVVAEAATRRSDRAAITAKEATAKARRAVSGSDQAGSDQEDTPAEAARRTAAYAKAVAENAKGAARTHVEKEAALRTEDSEPSEAVIRPSSPVTVAALKYAEAATVYAEAAKEAADKASLTRTEKIDRLLEVEFAIYEDDTGAMRETIRGLNLGENRRFCDMSDAEIDTEIEASFG